MSLPLLWVDKIFEKLTLTHGQAFLARWRDIDLNAVKSDWMHELSGFENAPHCIAFALANQPQKPPNVVEFKALCRMAPAVETQQLPEPKADPARIAAELAKLAPLRVAVDRTHGMREWAYILKARHESGEDPKLNANQIRCYQAALGPISEAA